MQTRVLPPDPIMILSNVESLLRRVETGETEALGVGHISITAKMDFTEIQ